jgi:hypothetical protein
MERCSNALPAGRRWIVDPAKGGARLSRMFSANCIPPVVLVHFRPFSFSILGAQRVVIPFEIVTLGEWFLDQQTARPA